MMDLPNHSVLVGGLDHWSPLGEEIAEPRLTAKLCRLLDVPSLLLRIPPPDQEDPTAPPSGLTAWQFPEWFMTQDVNIAGGQTGVRSRMLVHRRELHRGKFIDRDRKRRSVVPVRFVRACRAGHIGDVDWYTFIHGADTECRRRLWMDERGTSGDFSEVFVRCECGEERSMAQAVRFNERALGNCDGSRPWLGPYTKESCGEPSRLLIRTASNTYFPQVMSVISLPDRDETVKVAVDTIWEFLAEVEDLDMLRYERRKARVHAALEGLSDDEAFAEVQARRGGSSTETKSVKQAELETLIASQEEIGEDRPDGNFFARTLLRDHWERPWMEPIARVVLVHRLREVAALAGFTRFEALAQTSRVSWKWAFAAPRWPVRQPGYPPSKTKAKAFSSSSKMLLLRRGWSTHLCGSAAHNSRLASGAGKRSSTERTASFPIFRTSCCIRLPTYSLRPFRSNAAIRRVPFGSASMPCQTPAMVCCSTPAPPTPKAHWAGSFKWGGTFMSTCGTPWR